MAESISQGLSARHLTYTAADLNPALAERGEPSFRANGPRLAEARQS